MAKLWRKISPYWHICTTLVGLIIYGILWVNQVQGYDARITDNTNQIAHTRTEFRSEMSEQRAVIDRTDYNIQIIADKIGVKPLRKPQDE